MAKLLQQFNELEDQRASTLMSLLVWCSPHPACFAIPEPYWMFEAKATIYVKDRDTGTSPRRLRYVP